MGQVRIEESRTPIHRKSTIVSFKAPQVLEQDFSLFFYDFEAGNNFAEYFPGHNMEKVVRSIKYTDSPITSAVKKLFKKRRFTSKMVMTRVNEGT